MSLSPYLIQVALHATALSIAGSLALIFIRSPQRRTATSLISLLAVATLPWISALRMTTPERATSASALQVISPRSIFPQWTVVTLPQTEKPIPVSPEASPAQSAKEALPARSFSMPSWPTLTAILWFFGTAVSMLTFLSGWLGIVRLTRRLAAPSDSEWQVIQEDIPIPLRRGHIAIASEDCSPCVAGFIRPVIILPRSLISRPDELRWALLHEASHWRNSDSRWIGILSLIRAAYWWNPLVHYLISSWSMGREILCDLAAAGGERTGYGRFLIEMGSRKSTCPPLTIAMVRRKRLRSLRSRITSLLRAPEENSLTSSRTAYLGTSAAFVAMGVAISSLTIAEETTPHTAVPSSTSRIVDGSPRIKIRTTLVHSDRPLVDEMRRVFSGDHQSLYDRLDGEELGQIIPARDADAFFQKIKAIHPRLIEQCIAVTSDSDQAVTIEDGNLISAARSSPTERSVLCSFTYLAKRSGEPADLQLSVSQGFIPSDSTQRREVKNRGMLSPRDILATPLGQVESGKYITVFSMVEPVNAAGQTLKNFDSTEVITDIEIPAQVKIDGALAIGPVPSADESRAKMSSEIRYLDGPPVPESLAEETAKPPSTSLEILSFIPHQAVKMPAVAAWMPASRWDQEMRDIHTTRLPTLEVATGEKIQAWADVGDLRISVSRIKGLLGNDTILTVESGKDQPPLVVPLTYGMLPKIELPATTPEIRRVLAIRPVMED